MPFISRSDHKANQRASGLNKDLAALVRDQQRTVFVTVVQETADSEARGFEDVGNGSSR